MPFLSSSSCCCRCCCYSCCWCRCRFCSGKSADGMLAVPFPSTRLPASGTDRNFVTGLQHHHPPPPPHTHTHTLTQEHTHVVGNLNSNAFAVSRSLARRHCPSFSLSPCCSFHSLSPFSFSRHRALSNPFPSYICTSHILNSPRSSSTPTPRLRPSYPSSSS